MATEEDVLRAGFDGIADAGVYLVDTGTTGLPESLAVLGTCYGAVMALCGRWHFPCLVFKCNILCL